VTPRFISVANQKGGVGKTTTSVNLAADLAYLGYKTLLIDLDPQGNASSGLGIDRHTASTIYDVLIGQKELPECIQPTPLEGLFVVPANPNLIGAEVELINAISREKKLKTALKKLPEDFHFVIFDCPPSLGLLTINAFTASHSILIPTQCEYYALEGLGQLMSTFQIVKEDLNESLEIEGVVLTMFDPRNKLTHEVERELKQHFPETLYNTHIPRNVKLSESPSFGKPIILYEPESKGCVAYLSLAKEALERWGMFGEEQARLLERVGKPDEVAPEMATPEVVEPELVLPQADVGETTAECATEMVTETAQEIAEVAPAVEEPIVEVEAPQVVELMTAQPLSDEEAEWAALEKEIMEEEARAKMSADMSETPTLIAPPPSEPDASVKEF
jgi:chromosome partitioning protein